MSVKRDNTAKHAPREPGDGNAAAMGKLAASIGHEFNNPLGYVCSSVDYCMNYLTKLQETTREQPSLEIAHLRDEFTQLIEAMNDAQEGLARMNTIMHELQSFTSLRDITLAPFSIDDLVNSLLRRLRHDGIQAYYEPIRPGLHVMCDAIQLAQALEHIMQNAWQATISSKERARIRITTTQLDDRVVLSVEDYGVGMDEEILSTMFDPFMTTHGARGQLGMGLTLAQQIIQAQGGEVFARSTRGEGTLMTLVLRGATASELRVTAEQTITIETTIEDEDRMPLVTLVSQDTASSKELALMLTKDYEVKQLSDVDEALAFFEREPRATDFVLYDMDSLSTRWQEFFGALDDRHKRLVGVVISGIPGTELRHMFRKHSVPTFSRPLRAAQTLGRLNMLVEVLSM